MKMLANLILVRPEMWTEQKQGGIILPRESAKQFARGEVLETGPGLVMTDGNFNSVDVDPGERILYYKNAAVAITIGDQEHHIVQEREVLAILVPGDFADTTGEDNVSGSSI